MDLSIIIINYKTKKLTKACIESILLSNIKKYSYEIIVVDNGSEDGSLTYLEKKFSKKVKLIDNKVNAGFSKGNNRGIEQSKGEYILLLNSDTEVTKGAIETLIEFARERKDAGVVGAKLVNTDGSIQESVFHFPSLVNTFKATWLGQKHLSEKYAPKTQKPISVDAIVGAAFLITPEARKKVGLLDERYFMFFEDIDYCRKVKKSGLKTYYVPTSKVYHHHGASGKSLANNDNQWRRLVPSSKLYHGVVVHSLITFTLWTRQKIRKFIGL